MEEQYTNVRFESISHKSMKSEIKHDLRMNKISSVTAPENETHIFINDGEDNFYQHKFFMKSIQSKLIGNYMIDKMEDIEDRHRKLLRKEYNQSLNKNRNNSYNMGVLTFSESMRDFAETDLDKVLELGFKTIQEMCKEVDTKLHYISFHMDEKGIPHFHFFTDNFNSKGRTINPKRNKNLGKKLQDLGNDYFDQLGFKRGLSKEETGARHLSIKEYQEYQDTKKENERLKEENEQLKSLESTIMFTLLEMVGHFYEMGMNYKGKSVEQLMTLFKRYYEDEQEFDKLAEKIFKLAKKKGLLEGWEKKGQISFKELEQAMKDRRTILDDDKKKKDKGNDI